MHIFHERSLNAAFGRERSEDNIMSIIRGNGAIAALGDRYNLHAIIIPGWQTRLPWGHKK
ncbi:hypothetical protein BEN30_09745 [Magnetovibrio blakemorei]|uniref:Uncharacterized protein n=1 Tax=Magnetovibrio blakemorei TaxID=28181 RepID=A0A1E5Q8E6_9PROT|nr:hypothetical protein BEN30_09745 [Magnetovibrio blakemorei]